MKITRSALKNLIKEEMNRINEAPVVTGDDVVGLGDAVSAMSESDLVPALESWVKGGNLTGLELFDGVGFVKRIDPKMSGTYDERMSRGPMVQSLGVQLQMVYPNSTNSAVYVTAAESITPERRHDSTSEDDWNAAQVEVKVAIEAFNAQNDGKGSLVTVDGESVMTSDSFARPGDTQKRWTSPDGAQLSPTGPN
jgi:hypothetical protein